MTSITDAVGKVQEFHDHVQVSSYEDLSDWENDSPDVTLKSAGDILLDLSGHLENEKDLKNKRRLRAHLMIEELGELLLAMSAGDIANTMDALGDLLYVLLGTAATFDLPLEDIFTEIHTSNMTKEKQSEDPSAERVRSKGPNYKPPRLSAMKLLWLAASHKCHVEDVASYSGFELNATTDVVRGIQLGTISLVEGLDILERVEC